MKAYPIEALMSNPAFDPTHWMLIAFKEYIERNPGTVLENDLFRPYLLQAAEHDSEWSRIVGAVTNNSKALHDVSMALNRTDDVLYSTYRQFVQALDRLQVNHPHDDQFGDYLANIRDLPARPTYNLLAYMSQDKLLRGLDIWNTQDWPLEYWSNVVAKISDQNLTRLIIMPNLPDKMCHLTNALWPDTKSGSRYDIAMSKPVIFQNILVQILARVSEHALIEYEEMLDRFTPDHLSKLYTSTHKKARDGFDVTELDQRIWRHRMISGYSKMSKTKPRLTELMCRCGYMCSSSSGLTLHQKGCKHGRLLPVRRIFDLVLARADGGTIYTCRKCGRTCRSKSGHTLHMKRCFEFYSDNELFQTPYQSYERI